MKRLLALALLAAVLSVVDVQAGANDRPYYRVSPGDSTNMVIVPPFPLDTYSFRRDFGTDTVSVWYRYPEVTGRNPAPADSVLYRFPPENPTTLPWITDWETKPPQIGSAGIRIIKASGTQVILSGTYRKGGGTHR